MLLFNFLYIKKYILKQWLEYLSIIKSQHGEFWLNKNLTLALLNRWIHTVQTVNFPTRDTVFFFFYDPLIYYSDVPEMCQGLLDVRRDRMQGASGWQSPTINSQVPGWAMASGSCGRQIGYTSNHACSAVYSKSDHKRLLPVHAVLSDDVSNKLSGCFQFFNGRLSNNSMHVCRRSLRLPSPPPPPTPTHTHPQGAPGRSMASEMTH